MQEFDIVIVGGGPAGYQAAIRASQLGATVCVIEKEFLGGTCVNRGCIPTKALRECAHVLDIVKKADSFGINISDFKLDFIKCIERKEKIVQRIRQGIAYLFKNNKVELIEGNAYIKDLNVVEVSKRDGLVSVKGNKIIVATGSKPRADIFGGNNVNVIDSDQALTLNAIPKSILIIGGGVVGCEFACMFKDLGSEVTIVEAMINILPEEDEEIARSLNNILNRKGIKIYTNTKVTNIENLSSSVAYKLDNGKEFEVEKVIIAIGRLLNTENIGIDKIGVETKEGKILVNKKMQTNISNVYAAGDVTGGPFLAHFAYLQGVVAAENACGKERIIDYNAVPRCVYTSPEVSSIGLTEKEARRLYGNDIKIGKTMFVSNGRALTLDEREGFVKIISDLSGEKILGVHIIGPQSSELINIVSVAMKNKLTVADFVSAIFAHPTLGESVKEAGEKICAEYLK